MEDQQAARSAWPDPPTYYKRYTEENLELLKQAKKSGEFPENPIVAPLVPEFQLEALEPPLPPTSEYTIFDQTWQVNTYLLVNVCMSQTLNLHTHTFCRLTTVSLR